MLYELFAADPTGLGVPGLIPVFLTFCGLKDPTGAPLPAIGETDPISAPGWYYFELTADVQIASSIDLDPGGVGVDPAKKYDNRVLRPEDGKYTADRAANLDFLTAGRMGRLDNVGLDEVTAGRMAILDDVGGEVAAAAIPGAPVVGSMGELWRRLLDEATVLRIASLDRVTDTRMKVLDNVGEEVGVYAIGAHAAGTVGEVWKRLSDEATTARLTALDNIDSTVFPANVTDSTWEQTPETMAPEPPEGSFGWMMRVLTSISAQRNMRINPTGFVGDKLTGATVRVFADSADATADINHIAEFVVTAAYDGSGHLDDYLVTGP